MQKIDSTRRYHLLFVIIWGSIVAALAVVISLGTGRFSRRLTSISRGIWAGILAGAIPIACVWVLDAISTGEPKQDGFQTVMLGTMLFGLFIGFPVAFLTAKLHDRIRPKHIDPKIFE
ncbi:hypothetical protein [Erythrobacter sp. THAF29]|uniref:hypothetical protein n=1 Tax=Erythrobacter sp. THAF29 TaxID=2587851 RepID=UPI0012690C72|nr:hypothetical protein [Erythrobacter sp. THAF29]